VHNGVIDQDWTTVGPNGAERYVAYPPNTPYQDKLLRHIQTQPGLILGQPVSAEGHANIYRLPGNVRPLALEAASQAEGDFTYSDHDMLYDLGHHLAQLTRAVGGRAVTAPVERAFGIRDFPADDSPILGVLPGVEHWMGDEVITPDLDGATFYQQRFGSEFAERFGHTMDAFVQGYREG
jgi:hypothetical protein